MVDQLGSKEYLNTQSFSLFREGGLKHQDREKTETETETERDTKPECGWGGNWGLECVRMNRTMNTETKCTCEHTSPVEGVLVDLYSFGCAFPPPRAGRPQTKPEHGESLSREI